MGCGVCQRIAQAWADRVSDKAATSRYSESKNALTDDFFDHAGGAFVGDDLFLPTVDVHQILMTEPKLMQQRRLEIIGSDHIFNGPVAKLVGASECHAATYPAAGQPDAEALAIMVATGLLG